MEKKYIEKKKNLMHLYIGLNPVGKHVFDIFIDEISSPCLFYGPPASSASHTIDSIQKQVRRISFDRCALQIELQVGVSPITSPSPLESQRGEIRERIFLLFKIQSNCHFISIRYKLAELGQRTEPPISEFATVVYCPHFNVGCIWHSLNSKLTHHSSAL